MHLLRLLPALLLLGVPAQASELDHAREYSSCMLLARTVPAEAFESAGTWEGLGGGDGARHCAAVALIGLGQPLEAASRLEKLAETIQAEAFVKADLLGQAGQAWLLGGQPERAEAALGAALRLTPDNPLLLIDRAAARAERRHWKAVMADLDAAIEVDAYQPDPWAFRASAHRHLNDLDAGLADADHALSLDPQHAEALLERGMIRRLLKDADGARQDWIELLRLWPGTPAAETARGNLEKMDLDSEHNGN